MKIIIESGKDLCEVENLIMMADGCYRHRHHEHAANAVAALRAARNEYIKRTEPLCAADETEDEDL